jgi:hypothetical protein
MQMDIPSESQEFIDEDFKEHVDGCKECFPDCDERFAPGSFGFFELVDRSMQAYEYFQHYVLDSCATATDKEIYERAHKIAQALWDFYQFVALKDFDGEEYEKHRQVGEFFDWATQKIKEQKGPVDLDVLQELWKKENEYEAK